MSLSQIESVQQHYAVAGFLSRIKQAIQTAGLGDGPLQWSDLTQFDQLHVRGLEASKELAELMKVTPGKTLLDLGSGFGGPARYLAAVHELQVTGIDLTPEYVEVATYLSARCGLDTLTGFVQGDATNLPFAEQQFDFAWTQHAAMNMPDKLSLYKGVHRVLKQGGIFAIYDAVAGNGMQVLYPTPWAREAAISFLASAHEIEAALSQAGLYIVSSTDQSGAAAPWFRQFQSQPFDAAPPQPEPNPLSAGAILGQDLRPAIANFAKNVLEDRVRIHRILATRQ